MATIADTPISGHLSVLRCAAVGAIVLGVLFALCWAGAAMGGFNASHMFVGLFTTAPVASTAGAAVGICWAIAFGALAGALTALAYNALGILER